MLFISYANESSRLDENLPARSQFYSDHRVQILPVRNIWTARFLRLFFVFYDIKSKIISNRHIIAMFTSDLNAGVVPQMSPPPHDLERLRTTMVDFIALSIKVVFMALGVSYSRVLAQYTYLCGNYPRRSRVIQLVIYNVSFKK